LVGLLLYILTMYSLIRILKESTFFPLFIAILTMFWINGLSDVMFVHRVIIYFLAVFLALVISEVHTKNNQTRKANEKTFRISCVSNL